MLVDQTNEHIIVPLNANLERECKGRLELANSMSSMPVRLRMAVVLTDLIFLIGSLSEMAVLGVSPAYLYWLSGHS